MDVYYFLLLSRGDNFLTPVDVGWITRVDSCKGFAETFLP